jgi:hypothetical protein
MDTCIQMEAESIHNLQPTMYFRCGRMREKVHSLFRGSACVCQYLDSEYGKTCPRFGGQGRKKISYYVLGKLSSKDIILEFMGIRVICCDDSHKA